MQENTTEVKKEMTHEEKEAVLLEKIKSETESILEAVNGLGELLPDSITSGIALIITNLTKKLNRTGVYINKEAIIKHIVDKCNIIMPPQNPCLTIVEELTRGEFTTSIDIENHVLIINKKEDVEGKDKINYDELPSMSIKINKTTGEFISKNVTNGFKEIKDELIVIVETIYKEHYVNFIKEYEKATEE